MSNISKNNYWIKLYHEILHDPKMGRLPDNVWRRCIELFLMAGELQEDGNLPKWQDICWHFRHISEEQLTKEFEHLQGVGILQLDGEQWIVAKFAARQAKISDAEKQKAYRERKREETASTPQNGASVTETLPDSYQPVTTGNAEVRSKNKEVRSITTTTTGAAGNLATFYQEQTGKAPKGITDNCLWEDDCLTILDFAGGDETRAQLLMTEAIIMLDDMEYTHKQPGSLIETIKRNLQKANKPKKQRTKQNGKSGQFDKTDEEKREYAETVRAAIKANRLAAV